MRELSLDDAFSHQADVVFCELNDEAVILHLGTGQDDGLNAVGTRMWQLISQQRPLREVLEELQRQYDAPSHRLRGGFDLARRRADGSATARAPFEGMNMHWLNGSP